MPQIQVFQCPACGANLSYDGGPEITFPCQFCGTTIIVPEKLRSQAAPEPAAAPFVPVAPSAALSDMLAGLPLDKLTELKRLVQSGQKIEAIVLYRQIFPGVGLTEAKDAVEKLEAGQPLVLSSTSVEMPRVAAGSLATDQAARLVEVMQLALAGKKIEGLAIELDGFDFLHGEG
jgi:hypothetical protein